MSFSDQGLSTAKQLDIFRGVTAQRRIWDYLMIDGSNIANILFDPSPQTIKTTDEGTRALVAAMKARRAARESLRRAAAASAANSPPAPEDPEEPGQRN